MQCGSGARSNLQGQSLHSKSRLESIAVWFVDFTKRAKVYSRSRLSKDLCLEETQLVTIANTSRWRVFSSRVLVKAGYKHRLFLECLLGNDGRADTSFPPVNIRELELADTDRFVKFRNGPGRALFCERIRTGQRCYAAIVNGRLASVSWVVQGSATLWAFTADFFIDDDAIYILDSYTHPDFRGRRLQASMFKAIHRGCEDNGVRKAVTFVSETNTANLKSRTRLGFAASGAVRRFRMGPFIRYSSTGNAPELRRHISSNRGN